MLSQLFGLNLLRLLVAVIIFLHGGYRVLHGGIEPFGQYLSQQGFPLGLIWSVGVTGLELIGPLFLLINRYVSVFCLLFIVLYSTGVALLHAKVGWFVVGPGRNGAEFSALLIAVLLVLMVQHWPARR
ncbi:MULTISPECIES: DoxX family membrane protein [Rheinheimera]|uniref:DoxX family membrane protein n=1 Tax=Rheinheimera marina TaxID=1774958 RepID=A0ABV9JP56_9GAMM